MAVEEDTKREFQVKRRYSVEDVRREDVKRERKGIDINVYICSS